jgi:hypothetical protein
MRRRAIVRNRYLFLCLALLTFVPAAHAADRQITAIDYLDRVEGMWVGQLLGNYAGRQVEGYTTVFYEGPDPVNRPITEYLVQWDAIVRGQYYQKGTPKLCGDTTTWLGDDDTCLEFLYAYSLQTESTLNVAERTSLWTNNLPSAVNDSGLYIANRQAWYQIRSYGRSADESGSVRYNMHAGWAIDSQITTETLGALAVGMRQQAANLAGDFGGITNSGYSLHAAQFYAAMYADAPFASDVETLVDRGLEVVPIGSWTRAIVEKAKELHAAGNTWLDSRNAIIAFAHQRGRDFSWVESASNTGLTTLAILYGQGNFMNTVEFGVRGGVDSDCNPATAGGLVGMMIGQTAVLAELTTAGLTPSLPGKYSDSSTVIGLPKDTWTTSEVLTVFQTAAEQQIIDGLGSIADGMYSIPDDDVITDDVSDPTSPRGLVGQVLAMGGHVSVVVTRNGSIMTDNPASDRTNQSLLIDGVRDLTHNGVLPFSTYDGGTASQEDGYELHFYDSLSNKLDITFAQLFLHEGDIRYSSINGDPSDYEPYGGYFQEGELLTVEVEQDGVWVAVTNLTLSEALLDLEYFQTIELTFDPIAGSAVRIRGNAGGSQPFTTIVELEAYGAMGVAGDCNEDGIVDAADYIALKRRMGLGSAATWADGDFDGDGDVDRADLQLLTANFGWTSAALPVSTPEPASLLFLVCGAASLVARRGVRRRERIE